MFRSATLRIKLNPYGRYCYVPRFCVRRDVKPEYMAIWSTIWTQSTLGVQAMVFWEKTIQSSHHSPPSVLVGVHFCSEARRMKTSPSAISCINRDTVTSASFNTTENFGQLFMLQVLRNLSNSPLRNYFSPSGLQSNSLLISKFIAPCSLTENSLYNCKQEFPFHYAKTLALIPGGKWWMHNIIALEITRLFSCRSQFSVLTHH